MFDPLQILVSLLLFGSVFLLVWSVFRFPAPIEPPVQRRIALALGASQRATVFEQPLLAPVMNLAREVAKRLSFPALRARVRRDLEASGNPSGYSIDEYIAVCLATGATLAVVAAVVALLLGGGKWDLVLIAMMGAVGFWAPLLALRQSARRRLVRISKKLPYTLDLIALMMGAGATFTEAIEAVVRDEPEDDFNQELRIIQAEIELGTSRAVALRNLAERLGLDTLYSVVGAVNQSEALGTPLSTILKTQAGMLRMHRSIRAEKLAASASIRILIPSMLILMAVILALMGPMIVRFLQGEFRLR